MEAPDGTPYPPDRADAFEQAIYSSICGYIGCYFNSGSTFRIDGHGPLHFVPRDREPHIEVFVSEMDGDPLREPAGTASSPAILRRQILSIRMNYLPHLVPGSLLAKKSRVGLQPYAVREWRGLQFDRVGYRHLGLREFIEQQPEARDGLLNSIPAALVRRNVRLLAISHEGDPFHLAVPAMEVVRYYYGGSPMALKFVFSDTVVQEVEQKTRYGNWRSRKAPYDYWRSGIDALHNCVVCLKVFASLGDLRFAASHLVSDYTDRASRWIYESTVRNGIEHGLRMPDAYPPFEGLAALRASGIPFVCGGRDRFLALRIDAGSFPSPSETIVYGWPQGGRNPINAAYHRLADRFLNDVPLQYIGNAVNRVTFSGGVIKLPRWASYATASASKKSD